MALVRVPDFFLSSNLTFGSFAAPKATRWLLPHLKVQTKEPIGFSLKKSVTVLLRFYLHSKYHRNNSAYSMRVPFLFGIAVDVNVEIVV